MFTKADLLFFLFFFRRESQLDCSLRWEQVTKFWLTEGLVEKKNGLSSISLGSLHPWNQAILGQKYLGEKILESSRK